MCFCQNYCKSRLKRGVGDFFLIIRKPGGDRGEVFFVWICDFWCADLHGLFGMLFAHFEAALG